MSLIERFHCIKDNIIFCSHYTTCTVYEYCLLITGVPECNRFSSGVTISWNAQDNREYEYKITKLMSNEEVLSEFYF